MGPINLSKEATAKQPDEVILATFREVGQILAEARLEQNLTIKQVAAKVHIRQKYLVNLEEGQICDLPGRVYILGFIRAYARFLGLDGEELMRRIRKLPHLPNYERNQAPVPLDSEEGPSLSILVASGALVIFIAMGGYFFLRPIPTPIENLVIDSPKAPQDKDAAPPPSVEILGGQQPQLPDSVTSSQALPPETPAQPIAQKGPSAPSSKKFILKANEPSWIEVRNGEGKVVFMKVLGKGEEYVAPEEPDIMISTGNAGGFDIFLGETKLPSLGGHGDVKRGIRLEALLP